MGQMRSLWVLLVLLALAARASAGPLGEQVDAVLTAVRGDDRAPLDALAKSADARPWLVADELIGRGEPQAALAWARACQNEQLVRAVGNTDDRDATARAAWVRASTTEALAAIDAAGPILRLRIDEARLALLLKDKQRKPARELADDAARRARDLGWFPLAARFYHEFLLLSVQVDDMDAAVNTARELRELLPHVPEIQDWLAALDRETPLTPLSDEPDLAHEIETGAPDRERLVRVYFATDRATFKPDRGWLFAQFRWVALALFGVILLPKLLAVALRRYVWVALTLAWLVFTFFTARQTLQVMREHERLGTLYGTERSTNENVRTRGYDVGICDVSIPPGHEPGEIERPRIWRLELLPERDEHIMLVRLKRQEEDIFFGGIRDRVATSEGKRAFVFVHGYNVEFREAVWRTAQIAWDVQFDGAPILYSWPSQGEIPMYEADKGHARWAVRHLAAFLLDLRAKSGAATIYLVGHSMGGYVLTEALDRLALGGSEHTNIYKNVILAAPDIDADIFEQYIAPALVNVTHRVTLYASKNDYALVASRSLRGNVQVAGEVRAGRVVTVPGMDTIDVSGVSGGHSYIGDNGHVLDDFRALLNGAKAAAERAAATGLHPVLGGWWRLETPSK